jgi:CHASE2 domain-containing sensor protein
LKEGKLLLLSSLLVTGAVALIRGFGLLQPLELGAFDRLLQLRPAEPRDNRLLVVTITDQDIQAEQNPGRGSVSDRTLNQVLKILEQHQPRVIGLDLYRDFPAESPELAQRLRQDDRLIIICKRPDAQDDPTGILPPPEAPAARLSFSDFVQDTDGVIRRHLLFMSPSATSPCTPAYAFSVQLAFHYLNAIGITPQFTPAGNLQLKDTVFYRMQSRTGGYQKLDDRGAQILLNYRATPTPADLAQHLTVAQILNGQFNPDAIQDRVILIGVDAPSSGDRWATPYGEAFAQQLPGVWIHAQMTSQILSAVLNQRPLLWVWHLRGEILWIGVASLTGGLLAWGCRRPVRLAGAIGLATLTLTGLCYGLLLQGGWVPLIPAIGALWLTGGGVAYALPRLSSPNQTR